MSYPILLYLSTFSAIAGLSTQLMDWCKKYNRDNPLKYLLTHAHEHTQTHKHVIHTHSLPITRAVGCKIYRQTYSLTIPRTATTNKCVKRVFRKNIKYYNIEEFSNGFPKLLCSNNDSLPNRITILYNIIASHTKLNFSPKTCLTLYSFNTRIYIYSSNLFL